MEIKEKVLTDVCVTLIFLLCINYSSIYNHRNPLVMMMLTIDNELILLQKLGEIKGKF